MPGKADTSNFSLVKRTLLALEEMQARLSAAEEARTESIAIIGMGCRFPGGADDPDTFWRLLADGTDAIGEVPRNRWDIDAFFHPTPATAGKMSSRWGGFLRGEVDGFDAAFFGISPREASRMDPQQRLLLEVAWEALEDAGQTRERLAGSRTGVFTGICASDYGLPQLADPMAIDAYTGTGTAHSIVPGRLAYLFDFRGPTVALDTGCSSSLVAVHLGCRSLRSRDSDLVVAGGVNLMLSPQTTIMASQMRMMAADGRCKAFDARADGFVRGEGCGIVILKRLSDALRDGDTIQALIRGSAINSDGRSVGLTAPNGLAQQAVLRQALDDAGVEPHEIEHVEAHGTGTSLGDPIEVESLIHVLGNGRSPERKVLLGAGKTNIGHLEAAAGVAGLIKVVLSLKHQAIPPVLHFEKLNPNISLEGTSFAIPTELSPWLTNGSRRVAGASAFGWSGTNAHVIVEEPPASEHKPGKEDVARVLTLTAHTPEALRDLARAYQERLAETPSLADFCFTAAVRRTHHNHRLAVVGRSREQYAERLQAFVDGETRAGLAVGERSLPRKVVFVFPGQGGQWPGMARDLLGDTVFRAEIERIEAALRPHVDWSLGEVLSADPPDPRLERIDVVQPTLFAIQLALAALWRSFGVTPDAVIGHSMGEVAAAVGSGCLSLADGARVITQRSQLLRRASGQGAMAAVELPLAEAESALAGYEHAVSVAASNGPTTTVISGDPAALAEIRARLESRDIFCRTIRVDVASHSPQMDALRPDLEAALAGVSATPAKIPLYSTVLGHGVKGPELSARYWVDNLRKPVLFAQTVERLLSDWYELFIEISPHPTLVLSIQEALRRAGEDGAVLPSLRREEACREVLLESLGALWTVGQPIDWRLQHPRRGRVVSLPTYAWQRERFWFEPRTRAVGQHAGHPLLGKRVELAHAPGQHVWETEIDFESIPWIDDHRVQGLAVLPGAGYLEMALAAANEAFGPGLHAVTSVEFKRLLFLQEEGARTLQTSLTAGPDGTSLFKVHSAPLGEEGAWTLHAFATLLRNGGGASEPETVAEVSVRCPDELSSEDFYRQAEERGNHWGPCFQGMRNIRRGAREALAELVVPRALEPELDRYLLHPAVLDACLHVLGTMVVVEAAGAAQSFVPISVDRVVAHGRPKGRRLYCHGRLRPGPQGAASLTGDVRVLDETGAMVVELRGLEVRALDRDSVASAEGFANWFYRLRFLPRERGAATPSEGPGAWLVLADDSGIGAATAEMLRERGQEVVVAPPFDDLRRLLSRENDRSWRGVVHLWSVGTGKALDEAGLAEAEARGSRSAAEALRQLVESGLSPRLWLVTRGAQAVLDEEAPVAPAHATLWGLGRTIPLEHPARWGGLIDLDPNTTVGDSASFLCDELLRPDGEDQVAHRKGRRHVARLVRWRPSGDAEPVALSADGSYLVTGGLGGLGLVVAQWLVERGARHLVLLGRTPLPERSTWSEVAADTALGRTLAALSALEAKGVVLHTAAVDVADEARLRAVIGALRDAGLPPVRGAVHAAGVAEIRPLETLDAAALAATLRPKVLGTVSLERALSAERLDFLVLFSSMSAVMSSPLLGAYAAANAFLDVFAERCRAAGRPALSVGWGFWQEVGMAARFQQDAGRDMSQGVQSFSPAHGLAVLERLIKSDAVQVGVMPIDWQKWREHHPTAARLPVLAEVFGGAQPEAAGTRPRTAFDVDALLAAPETERASMVTAYLKKQVARVLRLPEAKIDTERPLHKLGLDSLMAVELKNGIETGLGVSVPMVKFLQGPSVAQLSRHLLELVCSRKQGARPEPLALPRVTPNPAARNEPFPLNDIQQAYWIGRGGFFELGNIAAHMYIEIDTLGIDASRLEAGWRRLIARHDMLRAIVLPDGRQQVQADVPPYIIEVDDLGALGRDAQEARLAATRERLSHQVLETDVWPLFEIRGSRVDETRMRLHLSIDILIGDIWSWRTLFQEWAELYRDPSVSLPALELTFRDYVLAEREIDRADLRARSMEYWRARLPTLPPSPELPLARAPGTLGKPRFERRSWRLEAESWRRLKSRGTEVGLTPSALLLAAFSEVLATWAKSPRFTINVTLFNRLPLHPQVFDIVGDFTSVNLLAVDASTPSDFETRAVALQKQLWEDLEHSHPSGVVVMRELARVKGSARLAAMPIVFTSTLIGSGEAEEAFPIEWLGELGYSIAQTPQVWIDHQVFEQRGALVFNWDAVEELFPPGLLDDMFKSYCGLLERLASGIGWKESERRLLPPAQARARAAYNATEAPAPATLLQTPFEERVAVQPDAPAVFAPGRTLTYSELYRRANALAHTLRERGARPESLVAVVMERGWEQVVAVLAVLQSGAAYLPISPDIPQERLHYLLENGEVRLALTGPELEERLDWPANVERLIVHSAGPLAATPPPALQRPSNLAYVIYTSGSTGAPKGVMIEHGPAVNTIVDINTKFGVGPTDRVLAISSLSFDLSVWDIFGTLAAGGAIVIPDPQRLRAPAHWHALVEKYRVTVWNSVPALMGLLVEEAKDSGGALSSLRLALLSGDWVPVHLPDRIRALAPRAEVVSLGGATEASIWSIYYPIGDVPRDWHSIPYGRPLANQRFYVLDEQLSDAPDWVTGELYIGGIGLARGYWRDAEKTNAKFIVHPGTGDRLYRTGDLGRMLPDGQIEFLGRDDFQVKINGYRVELGEVEAALNRCSGVREARVAGIGERDNRRLVACVILENGGTTPEQVQRSLRTMLPEYLVPARILPVETIPLTSNGKVDVRALNLTGESGSRSGEARDSSLGATELRLVEIWADVLEVDVARISVRDNFLELGGDSVALIRMLRLVRNELGVELNVRRFFARPTIEHLVELAAGNEQVSRNTLVPVQARGGNRPLFCVPGAEGSVLVFKHLVQQLGPEQPFYGFEVPSVEAGKQDVISIAEIARRNVQSLKVVQPKGPYLLAGYCWGSTVAMEMAHQLREAGDEVTRVILLDPQNPEYYACFSSNPALLIGVMAQLSNPDRPVDLMPVDDLGHLTLDEQLAAAYLALRKRQLLAPEMSIDLFTSAFRQLKNCFDAHAAHHVARYDGETVLAVIEDYPEEWLVHWRETASCLRLLSVRGTHHSMLLDPTLAAELATKLRPLLSV